MIKWGKRVFISEHGLQIRAIEYIQKEAKPVQKQLFVTLDDDEQKVYDYLLKTGKELMDIIALNCDFPIYRISGLLLNMELKGVIRPLSGEMFEAI